MSAGMVKLQLPRVKLRALNARYAGRRGHTTIDGVASQRSTLACQMRANLMRASRQRLDQHQ